MASHMCASFEDVLMEFESNAQNTKERKNNETVF
jgi:hypothetical protein